MAMNIHFTVRFLYQVNKDYSNMNKNDIIFETSKKLVFPFHYTVLINYICFSLFIFKMI